MLILSPEERAELTQVLEEIKSTVEEIMTLAGDGPDSMVQPIATVRALSLMVRELNLLITELLQQ